MIDNTDLSLLSSLMDPQRRNGAWERFDRAYRNAIYCLCRQRDLGHEDAEDATQQVLVNLNRAFVEGLYQRTASFRAYLTTVVTHAVVDCVRAMKSRPAAPGVGGSSHQEELAGLTDPRTIEAMVALLDRETSAVLERFLHEVMEWVKANESEKNWKVFEQIVVNRRRATEVARELNMTPKALSMAKQRVLARVRSNFSCSPMEDSTDASTLS